ncbi:MAG: hypothetical protein IJX30_04615 [Clostridia bacterium]|nr:hypothetical protein [Clostridia bacterium]
MSSNNPIKRIGMLIVFILCALITTFNGILGVRTKDILAIIVSVVSALALIGFCLLAAFRNDNKDILVTLALAAYAGINAAWTFIKACEAIAHGYFSINYIISLAFYAILLLFAIKEVLPIPGKEILSTPIAQYVAIACIWLFPIIQMFILPLFNAQGGIVSEADSGMLITLIEWLLQSVVFTWFIKN